MVNSPAKTVSDCGDVIVCAGFIQSMQRDGALGSGAVGGGRGRGCAGMAGMPARCHNVQYNRLAHNLYC